LGIKIARTRCTKYFLAIDLICITLLGLCIGPPATAWMATVISPQGRGLGLALCALDL
jgi:hypothetical protein